MHISLISFKIIVNFVNQSRKIRQSVIDKIIADYFQSYWGREKKKKNCEFWQFVAEISRILSVNQETVKKKNFVSRSQNKIVNFVNSLHFFLNHELSLLNSF